VYYFHLEYQQLTGYSAKHCVLTQVRILHACWFVLLKLVYIYVWLSETSLAFILSARSLAAYFATHEADIVCLQVRYAMPRTTGCTAVGPHGTDCQRFVSCQEVKTREAKLTRDMVCLRGWEAFWAFSREKQGYSGVVTYVRSVWSPGKCGAWHNTSCSYANWSRPEVLNP
jgi:hypothetical protein